MLESFLLSFLHALENLHMGSTALSLLVAEQSSSRLNMSMAFETISWMTIPATDSYSLHGFWSHYAPLQAGCPLMDLKPCRQCSVYFAYFPTLKPY